MWPWLLVLHLILYKLLTFVAGVHLRCLLHMNPFDWAKVLNHCFVTMFFHSLIFDSLCCLCNGFAIVGQLVKTSLLCSLAFLLDWNTCCMNVGQYLKPSTGWMIFWMGLQYFISNQINLAQFNLKPIPVHFNCCISQVCPYAMCPIEQCSLGLI